MKNIFAILMTLGLLVTLPSCYYDVEAELYPGSVDCDLTNVTFSQTVQPLIVSKCQSCHNDGNMSGNISLEGYQNIQQQANNGNLIGAIGHEPGFSPMPQGEPQLPECQIQEIQTWIDNGTPND